MDQKELASLISREYEPSGVLFELTNGQIQESSLGRIDYICSCIQDVISSTDHLEKGWLNSVRTLALQIEKQISEGSLQSSAPILRSKEKLLNAFSYCEERLPLLSAQEPQDIRAVWDMVGSEEGFIVKWRVSGIIDPKKAEDLISAIGSLSTYEEASTIPRRLFLCLHFVPYFLHWNIPPISQRENMELYRDLAARIVQSIDKVLGNPMMKKESVLSA